MSLRMITSLYLAICCCLAGPAWASDEEQVRYPVLSDYVEGYQASGAYGSRIIELVPHGQVVSNWTEMVTVTRAPGVQTITPRQFLGAIEAGWRSACPNAETRWLKEGQEHGRAVALLMLNCPLNPITGKPEVTLIKGIQGRQAFHTVQKAFRSSVQPQDIERWMDWLQQVRLCDADSMAACEHPTR